MKSEKNPRIHDSVFVAHNARVAGDVEIGEKSSVWYSATVRGDMAGIEIGRRTNIQDAAVVHVDMGYPSKIGDDVTVGHGAIVHGCTIGNGCTIGMGAIILNGAKIGDECMVGAGALVTQGKEFPARSMIIGSPASVKRTLSDDEVKGMRQNALHYSEMAESEKLDLHE